MGQSQRGLGYIPQGIPPLTNNFLVVVRKLMDDMDNGNNDMVNMLTQHIGTMFNPLIQNTNHSYQ